jgi:adenylate cyclase
LPKKYLPFLTPILAVILCSSLFFTSLDNKVFDWFLRVLPSLKEDPGVLLITVDDGAIENVGLFPWTRDILGDAIVFLREMGAEAAAFDLSYLDESPAHIDAEYVAVDLPRYMDAGFARINDAADQGIDLVSGGYAAPGAVKEELRRVNDFVRNELGVSVSYVLRDVDAAFADSLNFFGDSFLTLTMIRDQDILGPDKSFVMDPAVLAWLEDQAALKTIAASRDSRSPRAAGIIPAILKLSSRAGGVGFVNADPDPDGYRRRVHLVMRYRDRYYPHLILAALNKSLGRPTVELTNQEILLKNARIKGETRDIRIPRAEDGSVLVRWPKKSFYDYNIMSSWELIQYNRIEQDFYYNLDLMADSGFFSYWDGGETPQERYQNANYVKELLYQGEEAAGISFETYRDFRREYLESAGAFLNGPYEGVILTDLGDDEELRRFVSDLFGAARDQHRNLLEIRERVSAVTRGALCIIGVAATSMTDEGLITFEERYPNVGVYAVLANMILAGEFLDDAPWLLSLGIALVLALTLGGILKKLEIGPSIIAGVIAMTLTALFFLVFFITTKRYIGVVVPFASVTLSFLSLSGIRFFSTSREKSFLRSAFSRYLSPEVISQIIQDPSRLNLGGEKREMTALFTDIRGFSTISENLDPADLVNLLNLYLTELSNIILENRGTIDKYEGDAIIAFFGAPLYTEEHAVLACRSAIMMKKAETALNRKIAAEGLCPVPLFTRIGINTGDMVVGNMGTPNKMDYTIIGNAVNLAARLEGVNKQYDTGGILISEYTRAKIGDAFILRSLDRIRVVGINAPLRLYELLELAENSTPELGETLAIWERAMEVYEGGDFQEAVKLFRSVTSRNPEDRTAQLYIRRCETFISNPPPPDWQGVHTLTEK